jgi:hypothetical protein
MVFISARDWVKPRATVRLEGFCQLKPPISSQRIGPVTFMLVAQCLNLLRYRVHKSYAIVNLFQVKVHFVDLRPMFVNGYDNCTFNQEYGKWNEKVFNTSSVGIAASKLYYLLYGTSQQSGFLFQFCCLCASSVEVHSSSLYCKYTLYV